MSRVAPRVSVYTLQNPKPPRQVGVYVCGVDLFVMT